MNMNRNMNMNMNIVYEKIVNPQTGRKVSINSRLGRKIINHYFNYYSNPHVQRGGENTPKIHDQYIKDQTEATANFHREQEMIDKDHVNHIKKLEQELDEHEVKRVTRHKQSYKDTSERLHQAQDKYHRELEKPGIKCYRSRTRGTCELETYFSQNKDKQLVDDEDTSDGANKCQYSTKTKRCQADFTKWKPGDIKALSKIVQRLDYDDKNNMYWELKDTKRVPFITSQVSSDLGGRGHGEI